MARGRSRNVARNSAAAAGRLDATPYLRRGTPHTSTRPMTDTGMAT